MIVRETQASPTTAVYMSDEGARGFIVFTQYSDDEETFVSYVTTFAHDADADEYFDRLVAKFSH